jgi:hypothetical protein
MACTEFLSISVIACIEGGLKILMTDVRVRLFYMISTRRPPVLTGDELCMTGMFFYPLCQWTVG